MRLTEGPVEFVRAVLETAWAIGTSFAAVLLPS